MGYRDSISFFWSFSQFNTIRTQQNGSRTHHGDLRGDPQRENVFPWSTIAPLPDCLSNSRIADSRAKARFRFNI